MVSYQAHPPGGEPPKTLGTGGKILLVDDSLPFLRNFSSILQSHGYEVRTADSGLTATEVAAAFQPQLVALDYDMPGLDGVGTLLRLRERMPTVKVIFISGKMDFEAVTQALTNGASECVTKPVDLNRLIGLVHSLMSAG
jgi:two-component system OmpR family response regulator